jgi:hypothetical protein
VFCSVSSLKGHILGIFNVGVKIPNKVDINIASTYYEVEHRPLSRRADLTS